MTPILEITSVDSVLLLRLNGLRQTGVSCCVLSFSLGELPEPGKSPGERDVRQAPMACQVLVGLL
jgi:hypothetical protein